MTEQPRPARPSPGASRAAGIAATATTLVALVAMSATVAAAIPATAGTEAPARTEGHVVRAVAAVVAAARDLVGREHTATAACLLEAALRPPAAGPRPAERPAGVPELLRLGERLLDLPPPRS